MGLVTTASRSRATHFFAANPVDYNTNSGLNPDTENVTGDFVVNAAQLTIFADPGTSPTASLQLLTTSGCSLQFDNPFSMTISGYLQKRVGQ